MKRQVITCEEDLDRLENAVTTAAQVTIEQLRILITTASGLDALSRLRFTETGRDPLDVNRSLNLVEQMNQTFTYLASIAGARWLLHRHPECIPLTLNLGTTSGSDIESKCGNFAAETFAATHPGSNDKLRKDVLKIQKSSAAHKFVFFLSPISPNVKVGPDVAVIQLDHELVPRAGTQRKGSK